MRVFLDANILFSAAKTNGAVRELLRLLQTTGHECWIDDYVVFEAHRNLTTKGPEALSALNALVASCRLSPAQVPGTSTSRAEIDWLPEKDRPVRAAAVRLRCDALLTGDRTHFGTGYGKVFAGVMIHSPRSLAETLFR
jgi:predicted nucleic acid-binding protein